MSHVNPACRLGKIHTKNATGMKVGANVPMTLAVALSLHYVLVCMALF